MRIHWTLVVLSVIGTILLTWHLRTKDMRFLVPSGVELPPEDRGSEFAFMQLEIEDQPEIKGGVTQIENPEESVAPEIAKVSESDLGDLESSPGLSEYREFALEKSPDRLFELSSTLRARGQFQRALLAIERVIDTCESDPDSLSEAAPGISALSATLPKWNVDPSSELSLNLHLGTTRAPSESLKKAILDVALLIHDSSGDQLSIVPTINNSENPNAPENSPIALWLATSGDTPSSSSVITLRLSDDETEYFPEISLAVFTAIRSHLTRLGYPAPPDIPVSDRAHLFSRITRLMWRDFARSLHSKKKEPSSEASENETATSEQD